MANELAFALSGNNTVDAGTDADPPKDTAKIVYSGTLKQQKDVTIELFEVGLDENISTPKAAKKLATFKGDIVPVANPASGSPPGELKLTTKPTGTVDKDTPRFRLELGGETFQIQLTDLQTEGGRRFEIQLKARAKGSKGDLKFDSKVLLFARFDHFAKEPRAPVIAFVTGAESDAFFKTASVFWHQHADVVIENNGMSLEEIVDFLGKQSTRINKETGNKGWGEVNIVAHGNPIQANIKILKSSDERNLRIFRLDKALEQKPNAFKVTNLGLSASSRVVFRSCNIGRRADLLKKVREVVFADKCEVKAPKFLQQYSTAAGSASTRAASEGFVEDVTVHLPRDTSPSKAEADAAFEARFNAIQAARPAAQQQTFAKEKPSFAQKTDAKVVKNAIPFPAGNLLERDARLNMKDDKTATTPEERLKQILDDDATDNFDFTNRTQWKFLTLKTNQTQITDDLEVRASSSNALNPRAIAPVGAAVLVGSDTKAKADVKKATSTFFNVMHSPAAGLPNNTRIIIEATSATGFKVTTSGGATFTSGGNAGQTTLTGSVSGNASVKIEVGAETLTILRSKRVKVSLPIRRFPVSFRRELRENDPSKDFQLRAVVQPDIDKSAHYGSSNDADPSDTELEELSK